MFEQTFKNIDNMLHKDAGCTSELDYTGRWIIQHEVFRWDSWVAPKTANGRLDHNAAMTGDDLRDVIEQVDAPEFGSQTQKHELSYLYEAKIQSQKISALDELKTVLLHHAFTGQLTAKKTDQRGGAVA